MAGANWEKQVGTLRSLIEKHPDLRTVIVDLADIGLPKHRIDLERRRASILQKQRVKLSKVQITEAVRPLEAAKFGELNDEWSRTRNATFAWDRSIDYKALCRAALGQVGPTPYALRQDAIAGIPALVMTLSNGRELRLSLDEARELREQLSRL